MSPQEDIEEKDKLKTYYNALNTWVSAHEVIHQSLNQMELINGSNIDIPHTFAAL